jgi:hypothetical protein
MILLEIYNPNETRLLLTDNSRVQNIGEANRPTNEELQPSPLSITVIVPVTYNHMVEEVDSH